MKIALLIPVFNHAATVKGVIAGLRAQLATGMGAGEALPLMLVDDGSTDDLAAVLKGIPDLTLLKHAVNRGKGAALITGFTHAAAQGFTHVVTIDADGQHDPRDVLFILAAAREHPDDLIIGLRDLDDPAAHAPLANRKARDAARFWLQIETGQTIPDTQCGLRCYPLAPVLTVPHRFTRYDYETEILARLAWGGLRIRSVPIRCIYFPRETRISHFRPIIDTLRGVRVNLFLVTRRLLPLSFPHLAPGPNPANHEFGSWWRASTWKAAFRHALKEGSTNSELAMAFAMGIFVGLTPFYFLQTILAIYFARRLHLNVVAAVIGSQISIPPLAPLWATLSYAVGRLLTHGELLFSAPPLAAPLPVSASAGAWSQHIWPFLLGNFLVALSVTVVSLLLARIVLHCFRSPRVPHPSRVQEIPLRHELPADTSSL